MHVLHNNPQERISREDYIQLKHDTDVKGWGML